MTEVPDLRGDLVKVGDTIAYAAQDGDTSNMRVGKIIEIIDAHEKVESYGYTRKVPLKLKVLVDFSSGYRLPGKPTLITPSYKRFVKVGE